MTTPDLLPKPQRIKVENVSDDFIKTFKENKQYEMRLKTRLMEDFYDIVSGLNSEREVRYVIQSFWTVLNNIFPKEDLTPFSEVKIFDTGEL